MHLRVEQIRFRINSAVRVVAGVAGLCELLTRCGSRVGENAVMHNTAFSTLW